MSQIETNPLNNPTIHISNPTQEMEVKPATISDTTTDMPMLRDIVPFSVQNLNFADIAMKNKFLYSFDWSVGQVGTISEVAFTWEYLKILAPVSRDKFNFSNFTALLISIKPTANAFYQGLSMVHFDPAPDSDYYNVIFGITKTTQSLLQLKNFPVSPKTSDEINLVIPINFPFKFFYNDPSNAASAFNTYLSDYVFGYLRFYNVSPLATTSPNLKLTYTVSGQLLDLTNAATFIR